jgi:ATP-binding cassette, subfamily C, bacterial CydC
MKRPFFFLLRFLRPFVGLILLSIVLGAATVTANVALMGTSAYLIAFAALHPSVAYLEVAIVGVRFFGLARGIFRYLERLVSHSLNFKLLARLRVWLFGRLEAIAPAGIVDHSGGDLLARLLEDIDTLDNFYIRAVSPPLVALLVVGGVSLFLGGFSASLGWTLMTGLLISGAGLPLLSERINRPLGKQVVTLKSEMSARMVENLQGMGDLLVYGRGEEALKQVSDLSKELAGVQLQQASASGAMAGLNLLVSNLTLAGMLFFSIGLVNQGALDGILLAVIALITLASFEAVTPLVQAAQNMSASLTSAERIREIAETPPLVPANTTKSLNGKDTELTIKDLWFKYPGGSDWTLQHIHLKLQSGKKIALVGASGAGKSTLANLLLRFYPFERGQILLGGEDFETLGANEIRQHINMVSQNVYIFNDTLRQNLRMAAPESSNEALQAILEAVMLGDWFKQLPGGLGTWMGEQGSFISGGERQRLALARALLQDGEFVILDEPFANLDAVTAAALMPIFKTALKKKGMIWITHHLAGLEDMDEILVMGGGEIVERGSHAQLLRQAGIYARLWKIQHQLI